MKILKDNFAKTKTLHHAYVLEGQHDIIFKNLRDFLQKDFNFNTHGNPDFWHATYDSFGIEDGRQLKDMQEKMAFGTDGKKVFVISLNFITLEAQNSLLKVFEEPTAGTHFFIIVPSAEIFLPTIRSRVEIICREDRGDGAQGIGDNKANAELVKSFLKTTPAKRFELFKKIIEEKEKQKAIDFLNGLESELYVVWGKNLDKQKSEIFTQIMKCRIFLGDRSPSVKMILENIALIVPVLK